MTALLRIVLVSLFFFLSSYCKNEVEKQCELTCHFAEKCAIEAQAKTIDSKFLEKIHIQCLGTCTMFQQEFLSCKEQTNNCKEFYECLFGAGVFQ